MVRRTDRPLRNVRVSFEVTRLSTQHLIDAYERLAPMVQRVRRRTTQTKFSPPEIKAMAAKARRGKT